jgi:hypothetical protein
MVIHRYFFVLEKPQVVETNIAEHVPYDEQQKTLKEQDSLSNIKSHVGRVEPQEQNAESKVSTVLCFLYSFSFYVSVSHFVCSFQNQVERAASDKQSEPQSRQHKPSNFPPTTQLNLKNSATENPNVVNQVDTMKSVTGGFGSQLPRVPKEPALLDERSLLACIVRAVPAGPEGGIRISSTVSQFSSTLRCYGRD